MFIKVLNTDKGGLSNNLINIHKNTLKHLLKKIICRILPELKPILFKDIGFNWIENILVNVEREELTKFYSPYNIINSKIGIGTYISSNSKISNTVIGKFCSIGPNLICGWGIHPIHGISTNPYFYSTLKQNGDTLAKDNLIQEREDIFIGNDVFIGANVTILDGVTIGDGAVIGAGSVVSKDIPNYAVAVGVPIKVIKYRFSENQINRLIEIAWWNRETSELKLLRDNFFNIDDFLKIMEKDKNE